jgi:hypothetical protein
VGAIAEGAHNVELAPDLFELVHSVVGDHRCLLVGEQRLLQILTELAATGRYYAPITAWLRYFVNGDDTAKHFFWGATCDMC